MKEVRELMEKIRGFQVGDYIRIKTPYEEILYGEVLKILELFNWLDEKPERLVMVYIPKTKEILSVPLDDKKWEIRLSRRRKK